MISISYEYPETELYIDLAYLELLYCVVIYFAGWSYWSALFLWGWWNDLAVASGAVKVEGLVGLFRYINREIGVTDRDCIEHHPENKGCAVKGKANRQLNERKY